MCTHRAKKTKKTKGQHRVGEQCCINMLLRLFPACSVVMIHSICFRNVSSCISVFHLYSHCCKNVHTARGQNINMNFNHPFLHHNKTVKSGSLQNDFQRYNLMTSNIPKAATEIRMSETTSPPSARLYCSPRRVSGVSDVICEITDLD